jgi:hypothetical protein
MKWMLVLLALGCTLGAVSTVGAEATGDGSTASAATGGAADQQTLQQQLDELRTQLCELEAQLKAAQAAQEQTSRDIYAINDATGKLVTGEKIKLSGYIQGQLTNNQAADPELDFRVRRARLKLEAPVTDFASATLQLDATRTVELKDAYIDLGRVSDVWRLRGGQAKVPFMYDVLESSSSRLCPERTTVATTIFPGERDLGVWFLQKNVLGDRMPGTTLDLGLQNGQGPNQPDLNDSKDLVARLRFALGNCPPDKNTEANSLYIGYLNGEFTDPKSLVTTDKTAFGGGISLAKGPVWFRGEVLQGEYLGADYLGWYAGLAYAFPNHPGTLFARYDVYNENRDLPDASISDLCLGYQDLLDAKTRIILAQDFYNPEPGYGKFTKTDGNVTTLRLQVKY